MAVDPVISSKYGPRPLLDVPALHVSSGIEVSTLQPSDLTMAPPPLYSSLNQLPQQQQNLAALPGVGVPSQLRAPAVPADWPYAVGLPGSLFAAPPGPLPYKDPGALPYPFFTVPPLKLQPPAHPITDTSGNPLLSLSAYPEHSHLSRMYPGVHNPYPPAGYYNPSGVPSGIVPQYSQQPGEIKLPAGEGESFHLEGVLEYGRLTTVHFRDEKSTFRNLPEFLRHELQRSYGQVPATDVKIVARNGEYHVYATPRTPPAAEEDNGLVPADQRMIGVNDTGGDVFYCGW